ncbi:MAG: glycosyltransferase [bacterium]|nr:glycosyltransferase [bacterium]
MNQDGAVGRKKVLFVITKSNWGGAQRYVYDLATNLPKKSFEPVVLCGVAQGTTSAGILIEKLAQANIRTIFVRELGRDISVRDSRAYRAIARAIRTERPDILHLNSSKAAGLGALAGRIHKVPCIIFTAHGWAFRESRNPISRLIIYLLSLLTIALSHYTICLSEYDKRPFGRLFLLSRKMRVIRNAIQPEKFSLARETAREKLAKKRASESNIWVGSVGELTANKNMKVALRAVARAHVANQNIFYVVIGEGEEKASLAKYARDIGMNDYVCFAGYISNAAQLFSAFDIFFLPSLKEGSPYALLEAAHAELPVIASSAGAIPEMMENGTGGIICNPHDTECFAHEIITLAGDKNKRTAYAHALKARAGGIDEFDRMIRKTSTLYNQIAPRSSVSSRA